MVDLGGGLVTESQDPDEKRLQEVIEAYRAGRRYGMAMAIESLRQMSRSADLARTAVEEMLRMYREGQA
jgi:uncharacterized protein YbgA (DUF1722 family)